MTTDRYRNEHAPQPPSFRKVDGREIPSGAVLTTQEALAKQVRDLTRELNAARLALAHAESPAVRAPSATATTHVLKTWPIYFGHVVTGNKRFEIRRNDRFFRAHDLLDLREYDPLTSTFTGRSVMVEVLYLTSDATLCLPGFVVMSIRLVPKAAPSCA